MDYPPQSDRIDDLHQAYEQPDINTSLPVPAKKIQDYCDARDQALELLRIAEDKWRDFSDAIGEANKKIKFAAPSQSNVYFGDLEFGEITKKTSAENHRRKERGEAPLSRQDICRHRVDAAVWNHLLDASSISDLMDAQAKAEFRDSLSDPVPVTVENCFATLKATMNQAADMQKRGVVNLFNKLNSKDYKSNDCFHIGKRIVVDHAVDTSFGGGYHFRYSGPGDALIDLERAICLIEGMDVPGHNGTIVRRLEAGPMKARKSVSVEHIGKDQRVYEDDIWRIRWYNKGTLHCYIKSTKIRARLNQMIAEHFGAQLGDGTDRPNAHDPIFTGKVKARNTGVSKVDRNAYYTPPNIAEQLVEFAGFERYPHATKILEPSCGHGELMMAAFNAGCRQMHGVENHLASANAAMDRLKAAYDEDGVDFSGWCSDEKLCVYRSSFDIWQPHSWNRDGYTHVIMNPPFDHQLRHVVKAYDYLAKGYRSHSDNELVQGCLVAIMGANVLTNQSSDYQTFRAWLKAKNGFIERLPSGSFRSSGTDVDTIMVKIPS